MFRSVGLAGGVRRCRTVVFLLVALATSAPAFATPPCGIWSQVSTPTRPSARAGAVAIFDPVRVRTVMFGGRTTNDLWQYVSGSGWSQLTPTGPAPPAGTSLHAAYDPVRDRMLVLATDHTLWALSLAGTPAWTSIAVPALPPGTGSIVHDSLRDRLLLVTGDLWSLDLASPTPAWISLGITSPFGVRAEDVIYDSRRDRLVSIVAPYGIPAKFWELPLASPVWAQVPFRKSPPTARLISSVVYDHERDRLIRFGGLSDQAAGSVDDRTWSIQLDEGPVSLDLLPYVGSPGDRYNHLLVHDSHHEELVTFGGVNAPAFGTTFDQTWVLPLGARADAVALPANGGTVTPHTHLPCDGSSTVTFTATPHPGYSFVGWSGDVSGTQNPLTVGLDEGRFVIANFRSNTGVDEAATARLAIENVAWGAGGRGGSVSFALPRDGDAEIEIFDVIGRRWTRESIAGLAAGRHVARLDGPTPLRAGVHFVRLTQGSASATWRLVVAP